MGLGQVHFLREMPRVFFSLWMAFFPVESILLVPIPGLLLNWVADECLQLFADREVTEYVFDPDPHAP